MTLGLIIPASTTPPKYLISTGNWSSDLIWSLSSGGANDTTKPVAGDNVIIDDNSFDLTID